MIRFVHDIIRANAKLTLVGLVLCVIYLGLAITPSSYALGLQALGQPVTGLLAGTPRAVRSDEWIVFTPYVQTAVKSAFATHDAVSPYHESLKAFFALPIHDWAMIFKPYFFAFGLLPPANAFSFFYLFNMLAFLLGWGIFLRLLRLEGVLAISGALVLFFSQFVQVWWTSNCGAFALAPWPAIAWMAINNRPLRIAACAYSLTVWLLADAYPPFLYAYGLVLAIAILAMRRDLITRERVIDIAIAGVFAGAIFVAYFGDLIKVMQNTVYPGRRISGGGGVEPAKLIAHLFPFSLTRQYEPLQLFTNSNACEIGVVGSLVPMTCAIFLDYRNIKKLAPGWRTLAIIAAGLIVTGVWIFLPVQAELGRYVGLTFVPGNRLLPAFGWLLIILSLYVANNCGCRYTVARGACFLAFAVVGAFTKYYINGESWRAGFTYFDALPFLVAIVLTVAPYLRARGWAISLGSAAFVSAASFGLFNPLQSAYPIFSVDKAAVMNHLKSTGAKEANGYVLAPGDYGALINGAGIPAINQVMLSPQLNFFKARFSDLSADEFNFLFNRYAHISLSYDDDAEVIKPDSISIPISRFTGSLSPTATQARAGSAHTVKIKHFIWTRNSSGGQVALMGCAMEAPGGALALYDKNGQVLPMTSIDRTPGECFTMHFRSGSLGENAMLKDEAANLTIANALLFANFDSRDVLAARLAGTQRNGVVDRIELSDDRRRVWLDGWAAADGTHELLYRVYSEAELSSFEIKRVVRPDVAELVNPRYLDSGFRIGLSSNQSLEGKQVCIGVEDTSGTLSKLMFPGGKAGCIEVHK